jgi:hypothetical protein
VDDVEMIRTDGRSSVKNSVVMEKDKECFHDQMEGDGSEDETRILKIWFVGG